MLVWVTLKLVAPQTLQAVYQFKFGLLSRYMKQQLKYPSISIQLV